MDYQMFLMNQGQRGPSTWFYPKSFVKHKAKLEVLPKGSLTASEMRTYVGTAVPKPGAVPVMGIRPDIPGGPGLFYKKCDIIFSQLA